MKLFIQEISKEKPIIFQRYLSKSRKKQKLLKLESTKNQQISTKFKVLKFFPKFYDF